MRMEPKPLIDDWLVQLQDSGYRVTGPRRVIVELLAESECALGPIDVYDLGRKHDPGLGLVTVYRTLEKLEELGLAQRVHQPQGCNRYLRAPQGHEHLIICTHCGQAVYFQGDELDAFFGRVAEQSGFTVEDHWLQLFGRCARCQ